MSKPLPPDGIELLEEFVAIYGCRNYSELDEYGFNVGKRVAQQADALIYAIERAGERVDEKG